MKILLSLAACSPYHGSELNVGWVWLCAIAANHDVVLLCSNHDLPDLMRARDEGLMPANVVLVPTGQPVWPYSPNRFIARLQTWKRFYEFNRHAPTAARRVISEHHVDLIHQVTIATWRTGSPLVHLGKPFVQGPIGGAEVFPIRYASCLSRSATFLEVSRIVSGWLASLNPLTRQTARLAAAMIVTNGDTANKLVRLGRGGPIIRCPMLLDVSRFDRIRQLASTRTRNPAQLRIFSGGTLEARKGFVISLHALAELKKQGIPFHYTFGSHGPDGAWAQRLAEKLGLAEQVTFLPDLAGDAYLQRLVESDVFLFPSLRDNSPLTLIEAMAAGCAPMVLKTGGPGETVTDKCGAVLRLSTPRQTIQDIADNLTKFWHAPEIVRAFSEHAVERVREQYLSSRANAVLNDAYAHAFDLGRPTFK